MILFRSVHHFITRSSDRAPPVFVPNSPQGLFVRDGRKHVRNKSDRNTKKMWVGGLLVHCLRTLLQSLHTFIRSLHFSSINRKSLL